MLCASCGAETHKGKPSRGEPRCVTCKIKKTRERASLYVKIKTVFRFPQRKVIHFYFCESCGNSLISAKMYYDVTCEYCGETGMAIHRLTF